jgi:hypothetical protein
MAMGRRSALSEALVGVKDAAPGPVKAFSRQLFRTYGMATGDLRSMPNFIIIGTKRGGTTSLYRYLLQHPMILPTFPSFQTLKGVRFFDEHFNKGFRWYRSHFPSTPYRSMLGRARRLRLVTGEASPGYLFHPLAAARAAESMPRVKVIALLRNPIDRAYSHYRDEVKLGVEALSFEEALEREPVRLAGELEKTVTDPAYYSATLDRYSYLARGVYLPQVETWMQAFPADQLLILRSEDLSTDPQRVHAAVLEFLDLSVVHLQGYARHNRLPDSQMRPSTRRQLAEYFGPYNRRLFERLGRDFGWDS